MSKIEAVIFDWAGTTVDYGCFAPVKVFTEVFKNAGVEPTMEEVREPMGMLKWAHIRTMLEMPRIKAAWKELYGREPQDADADKMYESYEPSLLKILDQYSDPKPYVLETVQALRDKGDQDRVHHRLHRCDDGHCGSQGKGAGIRAGLLVQPRLHRRHGPSLSLHDIQEHGGAEGERCGQGDQGGRHHL